MNGTFKVVKRNFYEDPGHGWLKVSVKEIIRLGIHNQISSYSYIRNGSVFLEEDCDATRYIDALKKDGKRLKFTRFHTNRSSKIRSYDSYCVSKF